jgi:hypothetical protein
LIDLAGSEKLAETESSSGETGYIINRYLLYQM